MPSTLQCLLCLVAFASAAKNSFISLPLKRSNHMTLMRRDESPSSNLIDIRIAYVATPSIGNPPQDMGLVIDTGSSWVWVNPICFYARNPSICDSFPQYDPSKSSPLPGRVPFIDGYRDYYSGEWALVQGHSDTFWWSDDIKIPDQAFGIANDSDGTSTGFLGLGPDMLTGFDGEEAGFSVLSTLVKEGFIDSRAFSLGLEEMPVLFNDQDAGSLLFGGIDKNQFSGNLFKLQVLPKGQGLDQYWRYWIPVNSVANKLRNGTMTQTWTFEKSNSTFLLDSATTGLYFDHDTVSQIMADMPFRRWIPGQFPSVDCSFKFEPGELVFGFGENKIHVPYSALVLEVAPNECIFTLTSRETSTVNLNILGLAFLRAVYSVWDYDNKEIHLAQRAVCGDKPDMVAIGSGLGAVPGISGNCESEPA